MEIDCSFENEKSEDQSLAREVRAHVVCGRKKEKKSLKAIGLNPWIEPEVSVQACAVFD